MFIAAKRDFLARSSSVEVIRERILAEDKIVGKHAAFLKSHPIYAKTVLERSVQGLLILRKNPKVDPCSQLFYIQPLLFV